MYTVRWRNHKTAPVQEMASPEWTLHSAVDYAFAISKQRKIEVAIIEQGRGLICVVYPD